MYNLSPHIDPSKIFIINRSEIEGRIDATFYKEGFDFSNFIRLSKIAKVSGGKRLPEGCGFSEEPTNYRYLRVGDVSWDGTLNYCSFKYLPKEVYTILKRYEIFKNDLLIAIVGATVGKVSLMTIETNENIILTENCAKITLKVANVMPQYLFILLQSSLVQKQIQLNYIQTTLPKLGLDRVASLYIPQIPSIEIQTEIVNQYSTVFNLKQQKEAQAAVLLASIDDYLLDELGITLPEQNNSLQNRMFTTQFIEVSGGRIDPKLYDNNTQLLRKSIKSTKYNCTKLKELIIQSIAGDWGKDENEEGNEDYTKCLVVRATEFDNDYNLKLDNSRVKYRFIDNKKLIKIDLQPNDLLIEKSGGSPDQPVGRIAMITEELAKNHQLAYSNFIHKIRVDESQVNSEYLFCFLKTIHNIKLTDAMQSQTNGIRNLIMSNYFNQIIPLPPLEKQDEIATYIQAIRTQAKQLQNEAKNILEHAKEEVEQMILGV